MRKNEVLEQAKEYGGLVGRRQVLALPGRNAACLKCSREGRWSLGYLG